MPDPITSLIEKLEGAEAGSRELDDAVALATGSTIKDGWSETYANGVWGGSVKAYTTSLDAALALAERIVGGKEALLLLTDLLTREADASDCDSITLPDLPRLFCAAILRAQSEARV